MEREACVCDHGYERSDLCAEIIIIIIIIINNRSKRVLAKIKKYCSSTSRVYIFLEQGTTLS